MFKDLYKRALSGALAILTIGALLFFYDKIAIKPIFVLLVMFLGILASLEFSKMVRAIGFSFNSHVVATFVTIGILMFFVVSQDLNLYLLPYLFLFFMLIALFFLRKEEQGSIANISFSFFAVSYISIPLGLIFLILYGYGPFLLVYLLVVTKSADIAAYFGGRLLGKHLLYKSISPKKTKEGAIIGFLVAILVSFLFFRSIEGLILGAFLGSLGQIGDLFESIFKRDAKIKDSGNLPGFGGVLDMLDSVIFNIIFFYIYLVFRGGL